MTVVTVEKETALQGDEECNKVLGPAVIGTTQSQDDPSLPRQVSNQCTDLCKTGTVNALGVMSSHETNRMFSSPTKLLPANLSNSKISLFSLSY